MEAASSPTPATSGMWAPYVPPVIGEPLDTLNGVAFVLVAAQVRPPVEVEFTENGVAVKKMRTPVDLTVATAEAGVMRTFSGFAAGIVGQVERLEPGNLPALCRIVDTEVGRGRTRGLELVVLLEAGADVAAIARAQSTPIMPVRGHDPADPIPY